MKTYEVVMKMTIMKTYVIEAESEDEAVATACDICSCLPEDGVAEDYEQEVVEVEELT